MKEKSYWLSPVPHKTLSRVVTDKITDAILQGDIKPGEFLPSETQLSSTLHVGKSSIREATKMLEALGIIEIIKGQGCKVRSEIDSDALNPFMFSLIFQKNKSSQKELVQFRASIDTAIAPLAIDNITSEQLEEIISIFNKMKENYKNNINNLDNDILFHTKIYDCCNNAYITCIGKSIMQLFRPYMAKSNEQYPKEIISDHQHIVDALTNHNKEQMLEYTGLYIRNWEKLSLQ